MGEEKPAGLRMAEHEKAGEVASEPPKSSAGVSEKQLWGLSVSR